MNIAPTITFFINFASNTLVKLSGYPKRSPQGAYKWSLLKCYTSGRCNLHNRWLSDSVTSVREQPQAPRRWCN